MSDFFTLFHAGFSGTHQEPGAMVASQRSGGLGAWVCWNPLGDWCHGRHLVPRWAGSLGLLVSPGAMGLADAGVGQGPGFLRACQEPGAMEATWRYRSFLWLVIPADIRVRWGPWVAGACWEPGDIEVTLSHRSFSGLLEPAGAGVSQCWGLP